MDRIYDVITLFQKTFILRRPGVVVFADIIKIVTMFIKTIFKNSRKVKRIRNKKLFIKLEYISIFLDIAKFADFR